MFYTYRQNNSGGYFEINDKVSLYVIIEASSLEESDVIAENKAGIYFDGCDREIDCPCCGDRWYRAYIYDEYDVPKIYEKSVYEFKSEIDWNEEKKYPDVYIYYKDGTKESVNLDVKRRTT